MRLKARVVFQGFQGLQLCIAILNVDVEATMQETHAAPGVPHIKRRTNNTQRDRETKYCELSQSLLPSSSGLLHEKHVLKLDKQRRPVAAPPHSCQCVLRIFGQGMKWKLDKTDLWLPSGVDLIEKHLLYMGHLLIN